jgi:hypothetical protein
MGTNRPVFGLPVMVVRGAQMSVVDPGVRANQEPAADGSRMAAGLSPLAMAICLIGANALAPSPALQNHAEQQRTMAAAGAVRIVDPGFCANQTWPYIDERCLKRVDNPQSADTRQEIPRESARQITATAPQPPQPAPVAGPSPPTGTDGGTNAASAAADAGAPQIAGGAGTLSSSTTAGTTQQSNSRVATATTDAPFYTRMDDSRRNWRYRRSHTPFAFGFRF